MRTERSCAKAEVRGIQGFVMPVRFRRLLPCLAAALIGGAAVDQVHAAGSELHGLATYLVLLEVNAAGPPGRLAEPASRRIAAAGASLDLNRSTSLLGACTSDP